MARYIVQHRRGSAAQWADKNTTIPMEGEIVIEIDEVNSLHKLKIGDGIHTYDELAYLQAGDEIVTQVLAEVKPRVVTVSLAETWNSDVEGKYSQVLTLDGITKNSRLDLQPSADMLAEFKQLGLVFVTENKGGTITVYSVGNMPLKSYTMQATIVETECDAQDTGVVGIPVGTPVAQSDWAQTDETKADFIKNKPKNPQFGENVQIIGGENETDTSRVEVNRKLENYSASSRKFAAYDYNSFFTTDKLVDGKPLRVCTNVWPELQLDAYSNQNVATNLIIEDYNVNADKYSDDGDSIRRNINIYYPLKDGQIAIIEKDGILNAHNFVGDVVKVGATHTGWIIFENDTKDTPNRMFNDTWNLTRVNTINAPNANTTLKNLYSQTVKTPWVIFDNDGGTAATYNRLYDTSWWLTKLKTIDAPIADAKFKSVKVDGNEVVTVKKCTSTSRPTQTIAGELWYEEDTGRTIRRNKNNNGWIDMMGNPIVACPMYFDFQTIVDSSVNGYGMYALTVNGKVVHTSPFIGAARYQHDFEDVWSATLTMYDFSGGEDALPLVEGQRVFSTNDYVMHPGATIDLLSAFKRGGSIHIINKVPN